MHFPRSNPDLNVIPSRRQSRRQSRTIRNSKEMRDFQYKIYNPFRETQQQNYLPPQIRDQIQHMQYISTNSIKNIQIPQCRRPSSFIKNIQMMQQLARRQQQKFTGMIKQGTKVFQKNKNNQSELLPINISQDDRISIQLNGFYDFKQRIDDDFDIFQREEVFMQEPIIFYSNQEIEPSHSMDEEVNNYLK